LASLPRAPDAQRLGKAVCRPFMPACPSAVQCLGREPLGSMREPAYRLYNCARCQLQVRICQRCDHGNVYCAGECANIRRRESLLRAQARYQRSRQGARRHAERQRRWRARQRETSTIVTHQGSPSTATQCIVPVSPVMLSQSADASPNESCPVRKVSPPLDRCAFCGAVLPAWTRQRPWRWSG
jgi:hypothetical protein